LTQHRLAGLDGLRLLAVLALVVADLIRLDAAWSGSPHTTTTAAVVGYAGAGIQLTFVIAGFLVAVGPWQQTAATYLARRIARLAPAYWAAVVFAAVVAAVAPHPGEHLKGSAALVDLTMVQTPLGAPSIDPAFAVLWSFLVYAAGFAGLLARGVSYRRVVLACVLLVVLATVATASREAALLALVQPRYAMYLVVGIALGLIRRFGPDLLLAGVAGMAWLLSTYWLTVGLDAWPAEAGGSPGWVAAIGLSAISTGAVLALSYLPSRAWSTWVVRAGRLAYPLFLVHGAAAWLVISAVRGRLSTLPVLAIALVASVALAAVLHVAVEAPAAPRLRGLVLGAAGRIRAQSEADRRRPAPGRAPNATDQPVVASAVVDADPGSGQRRVSGQPAPPPATGGRPGDDGPVHAMGTAAARPASVRAEADWADVDGTGTHV